MTSSLLCSALGAEQFLVITDLYSGAGDATTLHLYFESKGMNEAGGQAFIF